MIVRRPLRRLLTLTRVQRSPRHSSQHQHRSAFFVALVAAVIAGLTVALMLVTQARPSLPTIRRIVCTLPDKTPCPPSVIQALEPLIGYPLLLSKVGARLETILTPQGYHVQQYRRQLPETLLVKLQPYDALLALTIDQQSYLIVQTGAALLVNELPPSLLQIRVAAPTISQQVTTQRTVPSWLISTSQELQRFFQAQRLVPTDLRLESPFSLRLYLADHPQSILINPQESALNLARLSSILRSDQRFAQASPSATLDVRFRLPVLRS